MKTLRRIHPMKLKLCQIFPMLRWRIPVRLIHSVGCVIAACGPATPSLAASSPFPTEVWKSYTIRVQRPALLIPETVGRAVSGRGRTWKAMWPPIPTPRRAPRLTSPVGSTSLAGCVLTLGLRAVVLSRANSEVRMASVQTQFQAPGLLGWRSGNFVVFCGASKVFEASNPNPQFESDDSQT